MACPSTYSSGSVYLYFPVRTTASDFWGAMDKPLSRIQLLTVSSAGFSNAAADGPVREVPMTATSSAKATSCTPGGKFTTTYLPEK
ncbi:unnamed protein product [Macrosiphum euphorbiae]|uniref:Uncharacterized protein n=1 Tax=Macrosiphum euphorbiae TaxID=13131 RepID=A0AAV0W3T0_9HEMI|nr:unnamed protein product [Macrosiphum euphorbiae]